MMKKLNKIISKIAIAFAIFFVIFAVIGYTSASDEEKQEALNMREDQLPMELQEDTSTSEEDETDATKEVEEALESEETVAETGATVAEETNTEKSDRFRATINMLNESYADYDWDIQVSEDVYSIIDEYPDCFPYPIANYEEGYDMEGYLSSKPFFNTEQFTIGKNDFTRNSEKYSNQGYLIDEALIVTQVFEYNSTQQTMALCQGFESGYIYSLLVDSMEWIYEPLNVIKAYVVPVDKVYWPRQSGASAEAMLGFMLGEEVLGTSDEYGNVNWITIY